MTKSAQSGTNVTDAEVLNITAHGIGLLTTLGEKLFLSYEQFPWFRSAAVEAVFNVKPLCRDGLHWPDLDVDVQIDSVRHPENYPLVARC
jgi:hypothetical protein